MQFHLKFIADFSYSNADLLCFVQGVSFITGRNEAVAKVIFLHLFVILFEVGVSASVHAGILHPPGSRHPWEQIPPQEQTPHRSRHLLGADTPRSDTPQEQTSPGTDTPLEQTPPGADTPLGAGTPQEQHPPGTDTPGNRCPPGAETPLGQTPPGADTPGADTPHRSRHPPQEQTPPTGADTPRADTPQEQTHPPSPLGADTPPGKQTLAYGQ